MKTNTLSARAIFSFFMILGLLSSLLVVGQQSTTVSADTLTPEIEIIKISEIAIKSGEVWTQTSRLYETLISDEDIEKMKVNNDSIVDYINNLLKADMVIDLNSKNIRYLNNKKVYWEKFTDVLDVENSMLASNIKILNEFKQDFQDEITVWENTKTAIKQEEVDPTVVNRVVELISQLEGVVEKVQKKNDKMLAMLDGTTQLGVRLIEYINRINVELDSKNRELFAQDQPTVFSISFADSSNWQFIEPMLFFYHIEVVELGKYIKESYSYLVFQLFLIIVLIVIFSIIKKRIRKEDISNNTIYKQMLVKILSRNISAALILGLFASTLIFPNRPELFKDITVLIGTIPLLIIASTLIDRKFYLYLYLFGVLIYLRLVYTLFAPDNLYSTITMIIVALIEIFLLWKLAIYFYKNPLSRKVLNNFLILLIIINLGFSIVGLLAVFFGATMLSSMTLGIPISNVFGGILFFTTAIIFNGLIEIAIESSYLQKLNFMRLYSDYLRKRIVSVINFLAVAFWIRAMMRTVNIEDLLLTAVIKFFTDEIKIGSAEFALWDIVVFFLVIWLSIVISKMVRVLLEQDVLNKVKLGKGVSYTIAMLVRYSIITLGVVLAVAAAGIPVSNLTVLIGAFGVGIGFGLQNIFNNLVSGFILLFERPIQIGDTIEVGQLQLTGIVKSIGIRSSNIRTFDGAEVIVPNGHLISNEVVNWTLSDRRRRIEIIAGVAYGSDPHIVKDLLLKILHDHPEIINEPVATVLFNNLGESSLDFRMLFWISDSSDWILVRSEVMFSVHDQLKKAGISIPFPQMDLHFKSADQQIDEVKTTIKVVEKDKPVKK